MKILGIEDHIGSLVIDIIKGLKTITSWTTGKIGNCYIIIPW